MYLPRPKPSNRLPKTMVTMEHLKSVVLNSTDNLHLHDCLKGTTIVLANKATIG